jgi:predicted flavoprotein YhiN
MMKRVGIVGAGPAGMMAALEAAKQGARVLLFDTNSMVGKLLVNHLRTRYAFSPAMAEVLAEDALYLWP